jgi:hypothetical protein
MNSNIHHIPQPSLAGHVQPSVLSAKVINNAIANRDMRRTEEEWQLCGWDGVYRKPSQITAIIVV